MKEQPEFDFDKVKDPVPQEEVGKIYEWIEDFEIRFPLDKLNAITDMDDPMWGDEREVALNIFYEIQDMFTKICRTYTVTKDIYEPLWSKLKEISSAIGHYDSISRKIVHKNDKQ